MKTAEEIRRLALDGLLADKAHSDMGIYPKSIKGGPNAYEERNDYQNGWNDAVMAYTHKLVVYEGFINSLAEEQRVALETLLFDESLHLAERDDKVHIWLCVNDTFYYAADAEDVSVSDLPLLAKLYEQFDWKGLVAWVARKRDMEPLERKFEKTEEYERALAYIDEHSKEKDS